MTTEMRPSAILTIGSNHPYSCRCNVCLQWWLSIGPEDTGEGWSYGPFTESEYIAAGGKVRPYIDYDGGEEVDYQLAEIEWELTEDDLEI